MTTSRSDGAVLRRPRPPRSAASGPPDGGAPGGPVPGADAADRLYGELQVIARRLRRAGDALGDVGVEHDALAQWRAAGAALERAEGAIGVAIAALPEAPLALPAGHAGAISVGALEVSLAGRRALFDGRELSLSAKELDLLARLARERGVDDPPP